MTQWSMVLDRTKSRWHLVLKTRIISGSFFGNARALSALQKSLTRGYESSSFNRAS